MNNVYLACYKGKKTGWTPSALLARFADWATRKLTHGNYSHCEIAVQKLHFTTGEHYEHQRIYECYSASLREGGVRKKCLDLENGKWDLIRLPHLTEAQVKAYFERTKGARYDYFGAFGVVFGTKQARSKFFCSEWCANVIFGGKEGWKFSPNELAALVRESRWENLLRKALKTPT